ncbi:MAG: hypothetical protein J5J00_04745 [Deltaproteobacteria bacterium]|nr:hypothetical protein [Deltaproteobacteria bacterium]
MAGQGELAREIRTRLEVVEGFAGKERPKSKLDELYFRRPIRQHIKEFAALFAVIFNIVAIYLLLKDGATLATPAALAVVSLVLYAIGHFVPVILYPVWDGWMKFAHILGIVMTTLILFVAWSIALIPISVLLKVCRIKVMDTTFRQPVETYWEERSDKYNDFKLLERQF